MEGTINLAEIVGINQNFQRSIQIRMDYHSMDKIESYIPTKASLQVLENYIDALGREEKDRATMLIGPYGKGKSHLLLILVALLSRENQENLEKKKVLQELTKKIAKVNKQLGEKIGKLLEEKKSYLPIFITPSQKDMEKAYLLALKEALQDEGLESLAPDTYFEKALEMIKQWKNDYPQTYQQFLGKLKKNGMFVEQLKKQLGEYRPEALEYFQKIYPELTAGSVFEPMVQMDTVELYKKVNQELCKKHGYQGMVIIFDEFSKFLEGYPKDKISSVLEVIQRMTEAANRTKEEELHLIFVAHKAIEEYKNLLDPEVINAYRAIEGRLAEVRFTVSMKNSYELIQHTLPKNEELFEKRIASQKWYQETEKDAYQILYFRNLFADENDFKKIVMTGCFPMLPVTAYLLLRISECAVQNERTVFTFLSHKEPNSLAKFLEEDKNTKGFMSGDIVYDYFSNVFKHDSIGKIHNEWLKAEYALGKVDSIEKRKIIKVIALLRMVGQGDEMNPTNEIIRLGTGLSKEIFEKNMEELKEAQLLFYRSRLGTYAFRNNIGIDLEKEIKERVQKKFSGEKLVCWKELGKFSELEYELPRRYNQKYFMTRYFKYCYIDKKSFEVLSDTKYLFEEDFSDGKILALVSEEKITEEEIRTKLEQWKDPRVLVVCPDEAFGQREGLERLLAVCDLKNDEAFLEENKALVQELALYEEDLRFEINASLEQSYDPMNGKCSVYHKKEKEATKAYRGENMNFKLSQLLSEICEEYYGSTPRINHELINKRQISTPIKKARITLVNKILEKEDFLAYQKGTAPEATIYRATFIKTGLKSFEDLQITKVDQGVKEVVEEIKTFIQSAAGKKVCFQKLYDVLEGKKYGIRKGVMPLYLAYALSDWDGIPVLYLESREVTIDGKMLENVNETPEKYFLYIENSEAKKQQYLEGLEELFLEGQKDGRNRITNISDGIYEWYCSLPQCSRLYIPKNIKEAVQKGRKTFQREFSKVERNAREILMERLAESFEVEEDYEKLLLEIKELKEELDGYYLALQKKAIEALREKLRLSGEGDLLGELNRWRESLQKRSGQYVYSSQVQNLLAGIQEIDSHDEGKIVEKISWRVLAMHMADWKAKTLDEFANALSFIQKEKENLEAVKMGDDVQRIVFTDSNGVEIEKCFSKEEETGNAEFLENEITELLEEYGEGLETNEKLAVMIRMIERICQK